MSKLGDFFQDAGGAIAGVVGNLIGIDMQGDENMRVARYQMSSQRKLIDRMNEYNSPKNQMSRFQDAGLNPHLIYGQGSPGNQSSPGNAPDLRPRDFGMLMQSLGQAPMQVAQMRLLQSQTNAVNAKTEQTHAVAALNRLQAQVIEKNPLLDDDGFKAIIDGLKATAAIKTEQVTQNQAKSFVDQASAGHQVSKIFKEIQLLEQRYKLSLLDEKLRAEVLKSKEFQNSILEIQKKFVADGEIGPQQIYQFINLLLNKAL